MTLRSLIRKGLDEQGLTRAQLADALGLNTAVSISKWIREDRTEPVPWRHWKPLSKSLGIPWAVWYRVAKKELPASAQLYDRYIG